MKEQRDEEESEVCSYHLEVAENGKLYAVTEYATLCTTWEVTATIEIDDIIYMISI